MRLLATLCRAALVAALFISGAHAQGTYPGQGPSVLAFSGVDPTGTNDSTTGIQNAILALPASGGVVAFPCGVYKISSLVLGNGSSTAASTRSGMKLLGQGSSVDQFFGSTQPPCVKFLFNGSAGGSMMVVQGPLQGWGLENIAFEGAGTNNAGQCLQVISAQFGDLKNLSFQHCNLSSVQLTAWSAIPAGLTNADSIHNTFQNTGIVVPNTAGASGINLTGAGTVANADYNTFINTHIQLPTSGTNQSLFGIYLGFSDSNVFIDTHVDGGLTSNVVLQFDYTQVSGFPTANMFYMLDGAGSLAPPVRFANSGSPGTGIFGAYIFGLNQANGGTFPAIDGVCAQGYGTLQLCGTTTGKATLTTSASGGHLVLSSSSTPTANSCAGFSLATGSTDIAGKVSFTSATSCAINFGTAFTNAPFCTVSPGSAASTVEAAATTSTLTATFGTANTSMSWACFGN